MKFAIEYTDTDDYTYSSEGILFFEDDSIESLYCKICDIVEPTIQKLNAIYKKNKKNIDPTILLNNHSVIINQENEITADNLISFVDITGIFESNIHIVTVDELFARNKISLN